MITIAIAKGYLWDESMSLFSKLGISFEIDLQQSRKLFTVDKTQKIKVLMIRPWDVPAYVEGGAADLAIVGDRIPIDRPNAVP